MYIEAIARNMIYNDSHSIILSQNLIRSELNGNNGFKFNRSRHYKNNFSLTVRVITFVDEISYKGAIKFLSACSLLAVNLQISTDFEWFIKKLIGTNIADVVELGPESCMC